MAKKKTAPLHEDSIEIRYDGPTDVLDADGVKIPRGDRGRVSKETAQHLLGCDYADVTVTDGDVPAMWPDSHRKIDALAETLGVDWPQPSNGEQPMTVAAKAEMLEEAGYKPDGTGGPEGDTTSNNDKEG